MRKILALLLALLMAVTVIGCGKLQKHNKLTVVCTVFPVYDWVRQVVGECDTVEPILLVQDGTDLHSYQPKAADMVTLASCDLIVRLGGTSEVWVEEALKQQTASTREELILSALPTVTLRQISAGSVAQHGHEEEHAHHGETDEHLWLSLGNAAACVEAIADSLCELDAAHAEQFRANALAYTEALGALDARYRAEIATVEAPRLVVADRFPFVYLTEDYGIEYVAAFEGCTTDTDADFSTVVRLAQALDDWQSGAVLVTESADLSLADSVLAASKNPHREIVSMDSLQSVTATDLEAGVTYLARMEENLDGLMRALAP